MRLLAVQDDNWLDDRRSDNHGRPACRAEAGFVSRWAEGWWGAVASAEALGWAVETNNKIEEKRRATFLRELIFGAHDAIALDDQPLAAILDG